MKLAVLARRQWCLLVLVLTMTASVVSADPRVTRLQAGDVLLLRHALAPGVGDPANFRVDDCSTQRNLSEAGRQQARAIGAWLRARGIDRARVYSSQWCRCLDTAELLGLGEVQPLPALNSFFQRPEDREPNLDGLRSFLREQPRRNEPLVLVTHQVTVTALTGVFASSGEGIVATAGPDGVLREPVRLRFDD